jgi:hypothetical protein
MTKVLLLRKHVPGSLGSSEEEGEWRGNNSLRRTDVSVQVLRGRSEERAVRSLGLKSFANSVAFRVTLKTQRFLSVDMWI